MSLLIGITGRSGSGKGTACAIFAKYGIPTVDTDAIYHAILREQGPCTAELAEAFGKEILGENALVDRKKLAACVFGKENTADLLRVLNAITHKYIMARAYAQVHTHEKNGAPAVLLDAPQLFEAKLEGECDLVLGILAEDATCLARITARDGISNERATARLMAQKDNGFFRAHCTDIIENNGTPAELELAVLAFLKKHALLKK